MPRPKVIRINTDELLIADVMHRRRGVPINQGTFLVWLTDLNGTVIPGSTINLIPDPDSRGTWKGLLPRTVTGTLTANKRYLLHYEFTSISNLKINGRTEVEAINNRIE